SRRSQQDAAVDTEGFSYERTETKSPRENTRVCDRARNGDARLDPAGGGDRRPRTTATAASTGPRRVHGNLPAAVPLHAGQELDERPQRPRVLRGRVPPLLP